MSYFAILPKLGKTKELFRIDECHINLWSLRGVFCRIHFFDVGLLLSSSEEFESVRVAVPFGTDEKSLRDLYECTLRDPTAKLLFGREADVQADSSTISWKTAYATRRAQAVRISEQHSKLDAELSTKNRSVWDIKLSRQIPKDTPIYIRARLELRNLSRAFDWDHFRKRVVLDFRVADIREAIGTEHWRDLHDNVISIENLNFFFIGAADVISRAVSPSPQYVRFYEGSVWNDYLGRDLKAATLEKLTIYKWSNLVDNKIERVSSENPFRVFFLACGEPPGFGVTKFFLLAAIIFLLFVVAQNLTWQDISDFVVTRLASGWNTLLTHWKGAFATLGALGLIGFVWKYKCVPAQVVKFVRGAITLHHRFQIWVFRHRRL